MYVLTKIWILYVNEQSETCWQKVAQGNKKCRSYPPYPRNFSANLITVYYWQPQCKESLFSVSLA